ncbi:MAG: Crp/Fnr family transcriptional regulator [Candidatus Fimisoma sp.]|jgi:CRP-like cAMP-binding protein|nr:Crp/Fnr family transcriptional regulator [Bacillota bacterium]MDD7285615.1 Crp/Fnr family transcriptional regulator [Bacillota bacterium]MDY4747285.1 Crp/Fnr family transcriptional regulator [Candidatus Fimisoma sp.]
MKNFFEIVSMSPLFCGIDADNIKKMLSCFETRIVRYNKNQPVFLQGDPARFIGIVVSGKVRIVKEDYNGTRNILAEAGPGEVFAEVFACARLNSLPVSVFASENSEIMLADCSRMISQCSRCCSFHSLFISNLLQTVARKTLILNRKAELLSKRTTREKVLTYLSSQVELSGSREFNIPFDRQELADFLSVDRSALSSELSRMRKEGLIDFHKNHFVLLK